MEYSTFGKHIIVDLWGVDFSLLDDMQFLEYHLVTAADYFRAHVLNVSKRVPAIWCYCISVIIRKPSFHSHLPGTKFCSY